VINEFARPNSGNVASRDWRRAERGGLLPASDFLVGRLSDARSQSVRVEFLLTS